MALLAVIFTSLLLAGCGGGSVTGSSTGTFKGTAGGSEGDWTVLVYMNADNDLETFGILNFNQMEAVGSTGHVKIVVQVDRSPGFNTSNDNWTGTRRYLVTKDTIDPSVSTTGIINSTLLEDLGELDMGNPDTLRDFIDWGQTNYPADKYCLVIWNHGSGWRTAPEVTKVTRNVSFDDTSGTSISTNDFAYALAAASPQIDLVAFDASLMQMLEVTYEMRNSARYLVGSEESPPGEGYVYDLWLSRLAASPGMSPAELGAIITDEYVDSYVGQYPVTESVIDLSKVDALAQAADDFAAAVLPHAAVNGAALRTARQEAQSYSYDAFHYKDLLDYAGLVNQLIPNTAVSSAYGQIQSAISSAIIYERHTGESVNRSHGISIYVPTPGDYLTRYESLKFSVDYPNWADLIKSQTE